MVYDNNNGSYSWIWIIFIILIFFFFINGNNWNNNWGGGCNNKWLGAHECGATSNCQVEKSEIINSAATQYLVQEKGFENTIETMRSNAQILANGNYWGIEQMKQRFEDERFKNQQLWTENNMLRQQIYTDNKFNDLSKQISDCCCENSKQFQRIELTGLKTPPFTPYGFYPQSPCGYNGYGYYGGYSGYNGCYQNNCCGSGN